MSTPGQPGGIWTEHRNTEGRTYWFNTGTKASVWEKPDELKTPFERALNQTKWKEYFSGGRKYYYNTESKESKWDMPDELLLLLEKVEKDGGAAALPGAPNAIAAAPAQGTPDAAAAGSSQQPLNAAAAQQQAGGPNGAQPLTVGPHTGGLPLNPNSVLPARPNLPDDPVIPHNGFMTMEEGEKAFTHLLRKAGVDAGWTWDQTMRAIITDPLYKALNTLAEKKACWEKYVSGLKAKEQEEREARLTKLRPALRNMLKGNPNVFHYTTFQTADRIFAQHPIWQQARIEAERKLVFEEYVAELKNNEVQESRASRARALAKVVSLFKELNCDVTTKWKQAQAMVKDTDDWTHDPELQSLPNLDILLAFEDYSRVREREYEEQQRRAAVEKTRKERKAREAFKALLKELVDEGAIKARSKWKEVYPSFREDERYLNMLGNPGSNPLELFWDVVDALDQKFDAKMAVVEEALKKHQVAVVDVPVATAGEPGENAPQAENANAEDKGAGAGGFVVKPETTWEEFEKVVEEIGDEKVKEIGEEDVKLIYKTLHDTALKHQADEKRRAERKLRHMQDDLRYAFKKLSEPLDINAQYEQVVPLIENLPEYKALDDEESRRAAFSKYVKRQKEKLREAASDDGGSVTSRKRKDPPRVDHRDERERDKDVGPPPRNDRDRGDTRDRDRERERDRERDGHIRDRYEKGARSSRPHHRYEEYNDAPRRHSRDYGREKEYERDGGYRPRHHRDDDKRRGDHRGRERKGSRSEVYREYEDPPPRGESVSAYDERDVRAEKRPRFEDREPEAMEVDKKVPVREETPEEGEI